MLFPAFLALVSAPLLPPVTLPPLTSPDLQNHVYEVERALEKGDFVRADRLAASLPKRLCMFQWDDRKVPAAQRAEFRLARDGAIMAWKRYAKLGASVGPKPDMKVSFEPELAADLDLGGPAPVVTFIGQTTPRVEAVIGLKLGSPISPATTTDVYNGMMYALGTYYGLARNRVLGTAMTFGPIGSSVAHGISSVEMESAKKVVVACEELRKAIKNKQRMRAGKATAFVDPSQWVGDVVQGDEVEMPIQITNNGTAPLSFAVDGDCGCIVSEPPGAVAPNSTQIVMVRLDTKEFSKITERRIRVYTSDMQEPVRIIPVTLNISPRFRFVSPLGSSIEVGEAGAEFDVYLAIADGLQAGVTRAGISGAGGKVVGEKWSGDVIDPETKAKVSIKDGYKFHITVPGNLPTARSMIGLNVATNLPTSPNLSFPITLQKGIVALPEELFMGELTKTPKTSHITVVRAGSPVKVTSVSIDAKSLSVRLLPQTKPNEQRIQVIYDGTAPSGDLSATVTIMLDDAKQPEIKIPVVGNVR